MSIHTLDNQPKIDRKIEEKIDELISQLTLKEKVGMCHGAGLFRTEVIKRLGIPALKMSDGPMGVRHEFPNANWEPIGNTDDFVSYLPCNAALASTWNPDLAYAEGSVLGKEARGRGKDIILAPGINIVRSPLCGRNFEYMSEDPYLISKLVVPFVKGVQENDVAACVKHFAVNNQETERLNVDVKVDERTLRELYLPAFEAAVKEGNTYSIMTAYNKLFGVYCSHSPYLLEEILREEWGFDGVTISDWGAVHDTKEAAEGGLDIEMSVTYNFDDYFFGYPLIEAVESGKVNEKIIDAKIRRILRLMYKINMFSEERQKGEYNSSESREKTLNIAREAVVLLKNEEKVLPLDEKKIKTLAVIGDNANIIQSNGGGSAEIKALYEITPLLGIKMKLGGNTDVKFAKGYTANKDEKETLMNEAVELAKISDAVVIIGGLKHTKENFVLFSNALGSNREDGEKINIDSEGNDKTDLSLPYDQDELIKRILEVNKNAVVVMLTGSPVDMSSWADDAKVIVQTWYNGMEGGRALAGVLFGDVNPSGKLPVTFPKVLEDCPAHKLGEFPGGESVNYGEGIFVGYRYFDTYKVEPQFCFGHGLSYTDFKYSDLVVAKHENDDNASIVVKFAVTNIGDREGAEVAQLYVADLESSVERPAKELKGFKKIWLKPGESKVVELEIDKKALAFYDVTQKKWIVEPGEFTISIGSSCNDIRLERCISVNNSYGA